MEVQSHHLARTRNLLATHVSQLLGEIAPAMLFIRQESLQREWLDLDAITTGVDQRLETVSVGHGPH